MEKKTANLKKKQQLWMTVLPLGIGLLVFAVALTPFSHNLDWGLYDLFLSLRPEVVQSPAIALVDVDDTAIERLGAWPWPRSYMAQALPILGEFGAQNVVFDIEYNTPSPPGVNRSYLERGLRNDFDLMFSDVTSQVADLFSALKARQIPLSEADGYVNELIQAAEATKEEILVKSQKIAQDNDLALAQAMGFFGGTTLALRLDTVANTGLSATDRALITSKYSLKVEGVPPEVGFQDFIASRTAMLERAAGAGFVNVEIDPDGKRRRIRLIETLGEGRYAQLVFPALLERLGHPKVSVFSDRIVLEKAQYPDGERDVTIPLDHSGFMLVNWPRKTYAESFPNQHVSIYYLINYAQQVDELAATLTALSLRDAWKVVDDNLALDLVLQKRELDLQLAQNFEATTPEKRADYYGRRQQWFSAIGDFVQGGSLPVLKVALETQAARSSSAEQASLLREEIQKTEALFANLEASFSAVQTNRQLLQKQLQGKLCIIGYVGTGTSDLGATPFQKDYVNVGTHASVANTILERQFLSETPAWVSLLLVFLLPFALYFVLKRLHVVRQIMVGTALVLFLFGLALGLFLTTGLYFPVLAPLVAAVLTFVVYSLIQFVSETREKNFIRKAWGTYLSEEVISQIVDDPDKLKLGGESRHMTAMFTDVRGFSTISEQLTATELVHLLNTYLSGMSDIILNEKGVIDKFEGDAIIAFWGAPLELGGHAHQALVSALKMKALEIEFNQLVREQKLSPVDLLTRIGVNTGEMVAGNMGTERKMNYTIMGNAVNLAARLEGVNKQYGTWILTTDWTAKEAGDEFLYRRLDRVRVVGINTPVRLMEVAAFSNEAEPAFKTFITEFHSGLDLFEQRNWTKAEACFSELLRQNPNDGPAKLYQKRSAEYQTKEPADTWDGVFNLTEK